MTGHVVKPAPPGRHQCDPGWTFRTIGPESDLYKVCGPDARTAHPPDAYAYPPGTRWRCDCSREWVSTKRGVPFNHPGGIKWRRYRPVQWWIDRYPHKAWLVASLTIIALTTVAVVVGMFG